MAARTAAEKGFHGALAATYAHHLRKHSQSASTLFWCQRNWKHTTVDLNKWPKHNFKYQLVETAQEDHKMDLTSTSFEETQTKQHHSVSEDLLDLESTWRKKQHQKHQTIAVQGEILYGIHPVSMALSAQRRQIFSVFYKSGVRESNSMITRILETTQKHGIPSKAVGKRYLDALCGKKLTVHQGVCADVCKLKAVPLLKQTILEKKDEGGLSLVLAGIHDPMNFGAAIRSALFFGVQTVFIPKSGSCRLSPVVSKASSGALEFLDIYSLDDLPLFLQQKKDEGWNVLGTSVYNRPMSEGQPSPPVIDIRDYAPNKAPSILAFGNEGEGLAPNILSSCSTILTIPPHPLLPAGMDALNVSAAVSILLHSLSPRKL